MFSRILLALIFLLASILPLAADLSHPRVWVSAEDRADIIAKINNEDWAASLFNQMRARVDPVVDSHLADRDAFIRGLPLNWSAASGGHPPLRHIVDSAEDDRWVIMRYLQDAIECGVVYYVTGEEKYAQTAADIMATIVSSLARMQRSNNLGNGGLVYQANHLKEARIFGAQIPVACDFIYAFVKGGAQVFDVVTGTDRDFPFEDAQQVFKTYADMAIEVGHSGSNWPVLESPSLVQNALMLDTQEEIDDYLAYYLFRNVARQDPLSVVAQRFANPGDVWPESLQYSRDVTEISIQLMGVLDRWDPVLNLAQSYPNIVTSAGMLDNLRFPNEDVPAFGDGHRYYVPPYLVFEMAYFLSSMANDTEKMQRFGSLIKSGIASGQYDRAQLPGRSAAPHPYFTPLKLLWSVPELLGEEQDYPRTRTAELPFAGLFLQRNESTSSNPRRDGLMLVVSGASYVHSNASGMNVEFYGVGEVMGTSGGAGTYTTEIHENYYRLFASNNTVISNGASASSGGWVNLGMDTVQLVSMEPMPGEAGVSPLHSFSTTSFLDRHNLVRPAEHQRTLALIRTSPTRGYYVDIFRARSDHPNEFHDYIYRNVGESLTFTETPANFEMVPTPQRFQASASLPWAQNSRYRHPGWHYFTDVSTARSVEGPVVGKFSMSRLIPRTVQDIIQGRTTLASMDVHMNGGDNRSYSKAMSPPSRNAPGVYASVNLPTMVVRQDGEAWSHPFAFVFESYLDEAQGPAIQSVETLREGGAFKGLIVESLIDGEVLRQYILNPEDAATAYHNAQHGITFRGHYGVVTTKANGDLVSLYIGDGTSLQYGHSLLTADAQTKTAYRTQFLDSSSGWMYYGDAMGWFEYSFYPFIYVAKLDGWLYHPYDGLQENEPAWFYLFKPEE